MSSPLSLRALIAIYAQQTNDVIVPLLTIEHPELEPEDTLYFALNTENVISRGIPFLAFPFDIIVPDDSDDAPPQAILTVSNLDRQMTDFLEMSITPPTITIEIILIDTPDIIERSWSGLTLRVVKYNRENISGALTYEKMDSEGFPKGIFSPTHFPGMF
jgi:hypothetical protein